MTAPQRQRLADLDAQASRSPSEEVEFRALSWFTDHADPDDGWQWAVADARGGETINWDANRALMAEVRRWSDADVLAGAERLAMPCWFIHGDRDPRPSRTVADLAAAVPNSRFHLISGAGHQPWRERPAETQRLLHEMVTSA